MGLRKFRQRDLDLSSRPESRGYEFSIGLKGSQAKPETLAVFAWYAGGFIRV